MNRGLYIAAQGMTTQMTKMDVVSNNIANVNTAGYKKDGVVTRTFDDEMMYRLNDETPISSLKTSSYIGDMNMGLSVDQIYTDFQNGSFENTGDRYDVAIDGDGFFQVVYPESDGNQTIKYTRDGALTINTEGTLVNNDGYPILGENGIITLPDGITPEINAAGKVFVNGEYIDTLAITTFEDNRYLQKFGSNLYTADENATTKNFNGTISQGYIETSNVNSVSEMVEMISLSRVYEASSKAIQTQDEIMSRAATEIGRQS